MEHDIGYLNHAEAMMPDYSRVSITKLAREYAEHMVAPIEARNKDLERALGRCHHQNWNYNWGDFEPHPLLDKGIKS